MYPSCNAILGILHGIGGKRTKQTSWEFSFRVGMRAELRMKSLKQSTYLIDLIVFGVVAYLGTISVLYIFLGIWG